MPDLISLEDNIYVFKVERPIENFSVEGVRKRLEVNSIVLSLLESDNKLFIVISYKNAIGIITHWQTWLDVELFKESQEPLIVYQKHLIVHIDEGKNIYKCCGPVRTDSLKSEADAFVVSYQEAPIEMSREAAESILNAGRKKIFRRGSRGTAVISFINKGEMEHKELTEVQENQLKEIPAAILSYQFERLEAGKWSTLEKMRSNEVLPLVELCKYRVKSLWQVAQITDTQITNLPVGFDEFKAEIMSEKNLQVHFNFFKNWLEQHSNYSNYGSDILTGTFKLRGSVRSPAIPKVLMLETNWSFQKFEVFRFDIYDINKVRIAALCKILVEGSWIPYKVGSCIADLDTVKYLLLCCYAAEYLEKQLKNIIRLLAQNIDPVEQLSSLQKDLQQLDSKVVINKSVVEKLVENRWDYINIYPEVSETKGSGDTLPFYGPEIKVFLWLGDASVYKPIIKNVLLFVRDKELLDDKNLKLLIPEKYAAILEQASEVVISTHPEM